MNNVFNKLSGSEKTKLKEDYEDYIKGIDMSHRFPAHHINFYQIEIFLKCTDAINRISDDWVVYQTKMPNEELITNTVRFVGEGGFTWCTITDCYLPSKHLDIPMSLFIDMFGEAILNHKEYSKDNPYYEHGDGIQGDTINRSRYFSISDRQFLFQCTKDNLYYYVLSDSVQGIYTEITTYANGANKYMFAKCLEDGSITLFYNGTLIHNVIFEPIDEYDFLYRKDNLSYLVMSGRVMCKGDRVYFNSDYCYAYRQDGKLHITMNQACVGIDVHNWKYEL